MARDSDKDKVTGQVRGQRDGDRNTGVRRNMGKGQVQRDRSMVRDKITGQGEGDWD